MENEIKQTYTVHSNTRETPDTSTLRLLLADDKLQHYIPGQFITIYFPELGTPEGKAYSISSSPTEKMLSISVKGIGVFSNRLIAMKPGDTITASKPYGYFYTEPNEKTLVLIAGGIGVAPFRSMILDALEKNWERNIILLYSVKKVEDIVFKNELDALQKKHKNCTIQYFITQQNTVPKDMNTGRINAQKILDCAGDRQNCEFLICGSISFTRDIWRDLKSHGVSEDSIFTEAFFS